jgi:hypothetical protein
MPGLAPEPAPTWDQVLTSFEASADESQALLASGDAPSAVALMTMEYDPWLLALPVLPVHLRDRANAVRDRQAQLIEQLQAAMVGLRQQSHLAESAVGASRPVYVDTRA